MYRLGVGDCFLLTLPGRDGSWFQILIDCGIHMAEKNGKALIRQAVADIKAETGGELDLVVGTHEHWDHLSGFLLAEDIFKSMRASRIWCAWTENLEDDFAKGLISSREKGVAALWGAARHMRMAGMSDATQQRWDGLIGFFGDSPGIGKNAKEAARAMRDLISTDHQISYRQPAEPPFDEVSDDWRIFVLGPPRNKKLLTHADPRKGTDEGYPLAEAENLALAISAEDDPPFDKRYQIDMEASRSFDFFADHYWSDEGRGAKETDEEATQGWRRIGLAWLDGAESLALKLDRITNNTSLVLALELGPKQAEDNPVLLFAADAQIGSWLSWPDVTWPDYHGRKVTGADLINRTILYKVGHHASQNATAMKGGLEEMKRLQLALVPTSAEMAKTVKWGTLPWPNLLKRLDELAKTCVLRTDLPMPKRLAKDSRFEVVETPVYFDVKISF